MLSFKHQFSEYMDQKGENKEGGQNWQVFHLRYGFYCVPPSNKYSEVATFNVLELRDGASHITFLINIY